MRLMITIVFAGLLILAHQAPAGPGPDAINIRWIQSVVEDTTTPLGINRTRSENLARKLQTRVDEFVNGLQKKLSELSPATFYANPPFEGTMNFTVKIAPRFKWGSVPGFSGSEGNRAAGVSGAVMERRDIPLDESETRIMKPSDTGKARATDYDILSATVEFRVPGDSLIATVNLTYEQDKKAKPEKLAKLVAAEIRRYLAAQSAHIEVADST